MLFRRFAVAAIMLMAAIGGWCVATGRISYVITHGVSMQPLYHQNDLVLVVRKEHYRPGDIAAYSGLAPGLEVAHRIIGGDQASGFVFKGDHNPVPDPTVVRADRIIGRAVLHIPQGGVWLKPVLSPTGLGMMGFLVVSGGAAIPRNRREMPRGRRKKKVKAMQRQGGIGASALAFVTAIKRLPPLQQVAAWLVASLALLGLVLGVLGWMKPTVETRPATGLAQSIAFSYSATVPRSAAYDSTVASSPDPIFRKLAHKVSVRMRYQGDPGTFAATTDLSTGSGWHTSQELVAPHQFIGSIYETTATLDLDAIDDRAAAAARAIGIATDTVSIALSARVDGAHTFVAPLQMTLTPVALSVVDAGKLTVKDVTQSASTTEIRRIGPVAAAVARSWAVFLLIVGGAGAIALYVVARRSASARTRAEIERLYPQLLIHVDPMPSPPGKPVVTVENFPALAKLAERYGQMILTWRRPDADDFIVRDEGVTSRYRVPLDETSLQNIEHYDRPIGTGSHRRKATSEAS